MIIRRHFGSKRSRAAPNGPKAVTVTAAEEEGSPVGEPDGEGVRHDGWQFLICLPAVVRPVCRLLCGSRG